MSKKRVLSRLFGREREAGKICGGSFSDLAADTADVNDNAHNLAAVAAAAG
jgi:hypothetical protein